MRIRLWLRSHRIMAILGAAVLLAAGSTTVANALTRNQYAHQKEALLQQQLQNDWARKKAEGYKQTIPGYKPVVLNPEPTWAQKSGRVADLSATVGVPALRGANDVWLDGSVPSSDHTLWSQLYIFATPGQSGQPLLGSYLMNPPSAALATQYDHIWPCPKAVGTLTITAVTGPQGVVRFSSATGVSGTFDLVRQAWTFSG